jgi:hypothetical protein
MNANTNPVPSAKPVLSILLKSRDLTDVEQKQYDSWLIQKDYEQSSKY